jgi:hypothetical protein
LVSCKNSESKKSDNSCPYKYSEWMEVSDSTQRKVSAEVDLRFGTSINLLQEILKSGDTSAKAQLNTILKKEKNRNTGKKFKVSQEFFEFYMGKSFDLCAIYEIITKNPSIDSAKRSYYLDRLINISFEYQRYFKPDGVGNEKTIINAPVTNYGVNNGTMIGAITIEESGIKNGSASYYRKELIDSRISFKLAPQKGMWMNPFFAIPYSEKDSIGLNFIPNNSSVLSLEQGWKIIPYEGSDLKIYYYTWNGPLTINTPFQLVFNKLPSVILYGDYWEKGQTFILTSHLAESLPFN